MVSGEEHAQVVMERDAWEAIARERHTALEQLQADRSHATIRWAGRFSLFAVIMMIVVMMFAGAIIIAAALRPPALPSKRGTPPLEQP